MYQILDLAAKAAIIAATATSPAAHHSPAVTNHPIHPVLTASVHQQKQAINYRHVTVQTGDSLSKLAAQHGVPGGWESIYAANQGKIKNPDLIFPGWSLKIPDQAMTASTTTAYKPRHAAATTSSGGHDADQAACTPNCPWGDGDKDGMDLDHSPFHDAAPVSSPVQTVSSDAEGSSTSSSHHYKARHSASNGNYGSGSVSPTSSFEACVIARESGGNSQVMNSSGHYGLYQFSQSTWEAYGGSASSFGHASASEQKRVFDNAIAQGGQSNWSPYDGC